MKKILFILLLLAVPVLLLAEEPVRVWKSRTGKTIIAAALDLDHDSDPETVYLLKGGKLFRIPFKNLSQADQEYVTKARAEADDDDFQLVTENRGLDVVSSGKRYALLIGVNQYAKPIKSLRYCVKDMELLAECFQKTGIPQENIILVTDDSPAERRPTGGNIRRQIEVLTNIMEPDDQLIVAFSGHGAMVDGESYLCPSDTNLKDKNSVVSRSWVFEQLEKCKAKQKVFIIDACRNEISFNGGKTLGQVRTIEDPIGEDTHGFILIASCDKKQQSWEHPDIQHGVFTYFFAQGLLGAAKNDSGYVTIMSLFRYASSKTKIYVFHKFNAAQVPTFRQGDEMTDFNLAKVSGAVEDVLQISAEPEQSPSFSLVQKPSKPLKAGDRLVYKINNVEFAFRYCPPGSFIMGSPYNEEDREDDETQHVVTLTKGFWMQETELSQKQWKAVMGYVPMRNSIFGLNDDFPVMFISWNDFQMFCSKCAELGLPVQLPTEAQWEYACRAGTTGPFAGNLDELAWYNKEDETGMIGIRVAPYPVGTKKPNAWGLYDMHGNAGEWCQDWYDSYPHGKVTDPTGPVSGSKRVYRGGYHGCDAGRCRSAIRNSEEPDQDLSTIGFRVALSNDMPEN